MEGALVASDAPLEEREAITNLLWGEPSQAKRGRKPTLRTEAIARAGIAIADADGLGATTMQRVGEALDVTKMALYRHVSGKTALIALMIDTGLGEPPLLETVPGGWRLKLDHWARLLCDRFAQHPWAIEATAEARIMGPNELGWLEQACGVLAGTHLTGSEILDLVVVLIGHISTIARNQSTYAGDNPERVLSTMMATLVRGREERFPHLTAALASAAEHAGQDQALDFGLNRIFDGVEMLMAGRA